MNNLNIKTRDDLKAISAQIKPMLPLTGFNSVNEALKAMYEIPASEELNTFKGWKEKGYSVKKGEHAFTFWSAPIKRKKKQEEEAEAQDAEEKAGHFAICKLFASYQVEKQEVKNESF